MSKFKKLLNQLCEPFFFALDQLNSSYLIEEPASVAQFYACPIGDQDLAGSTPATFFHGD